MNQFAISLTVVLFLGWIGATAYANPVALSDFKPDQLVDDNGVIQDADLDKVFGDLVLNKQDEMAQEQIFGILKGLYHGYQLGRSLYRGYKAGKKRGWWNTDIQQDEDDGQIQMYNAFRELMQSKEKNIALAQFLNTWYPSGITMPLQQDEAAKEQIFGLLKGLYHGYKFGRSLYRGYKAGKKRGWWNTDIQQDEANGELQDAEMYNALSRVSQRNLKQGEKPELSKVIDALKGYLSPNSEQVKGQ